MRRHTLLTAVASSRDVAAQRRIAPAAFLLRARAGGGVHRTSSVLRCSCSRRGVHRTSCDLRYSCPWWSTLHKLCLPFLLRPWMIDYMTPVAAVIVAPSPVDEHISPATVEDAAPAPVFECACASEVCGTYARGLVHCACACSRCAPASMVELVTPVPVGNAAPAPVVELISPASGVRYSGTCR